MRQIVLDTETTGLPEDPDAAVIEVAASIWDMSSGSYSFFDISYLLV